MQSSFIIYHSNLFTTAVSVTCCTYYTQIYKQCLQKISIIDDTLEGLHIPKEYNNFSKKVTRNVIIWILISIAINLSQIPWYLEKATGINICLAPFLINYTLHVNSLMETLYATLIWYVASIFQRINKYILHLSANDNCGIKMMWKKVPSRSFHRRSLIDTSQHKYSLLTVITCHTLHRVFQIQLTTTMANHFILIVLFTYFQYTYFLNEPNIRIQYMLNYIGLAMMLLFFVAKVVFLNNNIEKCCKKAYHTVYVLYTLRDFTHNPERQEEISQFILQIVQKRLRLSAMGSVYFGHRFLCTFFIIIINYVIIIIQFNTT
ncbi:hypothetical protein KPH14_008666 [Odynerus spinipes]|uniref:Gustatory receptor n=1 Tax=Odynerus spinipes TaxID=1348599 RepID=A0AAD9RSS1_9HYME|nr:hypothetical protein KPH14_008666 [Odynerus spinipes]